MLRFLKLVRRPAARPRTAMVLASALVGLAAVACATAVAPSPTAGPPSSTIPAPAPSSTAGLSEGRNYSDAVAQRIDAAVADLLRKARETASRIIELNRSGLNLVVEKLLAEETLQGPALEELLRGSELEPALAA